jgi:DNA-binding response OmpR family regulator
MINKKPTVVVVDDSPAMQTLYERGTQKLDIELKLFKSVAETWSFLQSNKPDLLILSIILPDKNGLIFLQELRKSPEHEDTSVVMVSSKDYAQDKLAAEGLGVLEFISKPMPMQTIEEVVVKYTNAKPGSK